MSILSYFIFLYLHLINNFILIDILGAELLYKSLYPYVRRVCK